jgi:hypothetical protein
MGQWAFVFQHLPEIAAVYPTSAGRALEKMLGLVGWRTAQARSDVFAARHFDHAYMSSRNPL